MEKIHSFTQLLVWKKGHEIVLDVYQITRNFPKNESSSLADQMRRAVVSITSNIAEGFSRRSAKEKRQFFSVALGSSTELQNQLLISRDIGYLDADRFMEIAQKTVELQKMLNAFRSKIKNV